MTCALLEVPWRLISSMLKRITVNATTAANGSRAAGKTLCAPTAILMTFRNYKRSGTCSCIFLFPDYSHELSPYDSEMKSSEKFSISMCPCHRTGNP